MRACWPASTLSPARFTLWSRIATAAANSSNFPSFSTPPTGSQTIKAILDNHFVRISKETKAWLANQPTGRFEFTFTPKHGSWLNLVEGFFSKLARSVLRHIQVASKQELKDRIMTAIDHFNRYPVIRMGPINSTRPLDMNSNFGNDELGGERCVTRSGPANFRAAPAKPN